MTQLQAGVDFGDYRVLSLLGEGGMGRVWLVENRQLHRREALKLVTAAGGDGGFAQRFENEARTAASLDHPSIVTVYAYGITDTTPWFTMTYLAGDDLAGVGALPVGEVAEVISRAAGALDYAHSRGVVHRDVKPANIMVERDAHGRPERVVLLDFGIARLLDGARMTGTNNFIGTLSYAAPEVLDSGTSGPASDQYSLACAAYELLTGHPPFERATTGALITAHLTASPPPVTGAPGPVDAVLGRALAKQPGQRYASCGEFAAALVEALRRSVADPGATMAIPRGSGPTAMAPAPVYSAPAHVVAPYPGPIQSGPTHVVAPHPGPTQSGPTYAVPHPGASHGTTAIQQDAYGGGYGSAPQYPSDQYPSPQYAQPAVPDGGRRGNGMVVAALVAVVVLLIGGIAFVVTRGGSDDANPREAADSGAGQPADPARLTSMLLPASSLPYGFADEYTNKLEYISRQASRFGGTTFTPSSCGPIRFWLDVDPPNVELRTAYSSSTSEWLYVGVSTEGRTVDEVRDDYPAECRDIVVERRDSDGTLARSRSIFNDLPTPSTRADDALVMSYDSTDLTREAPRGFGIVGFADVNGYRVIVELIGPPAQVSTAQFDEIFADAVDWAAQNS